MQENKKRKIKQNILKNNKILLNNREIICNNQKNINYKKLSFHYLYYKEKNILKSNKIKTYVENNNEMRNNQILKISKIIDHEILKNNQKYRQIGNKLLIEIIAESLAHEILIQQNFNIYSAFNELSREIKIYKKEASVLNILLISNLIDIYIKLQNDIIYIKKQVKKCQNIKKIKSSLSSIQIYGIYLYNKSSSMLLSIKKEDVVRATTFVLNELDNISYKQKIIFNYITFIAKNTKFSAQ